MNSVKVLGISTVVSVVVVTGALSFGLFSSGTKVIEREIPKKDLGAIPGNAVEGSYFTIGGIEYAHIKQPWIATTTRVCIIKNPFPNATSTLLSFTAKNTNLVVGANTFDIATTTHLNGFGATSSQAILRGFTVATNEYAATDGVNGSNNIPTLLFPKENLNLRRYATTSAGTDNYTGVCTARFQKL
jgi:hypothetical protein